MRISRFRKLLYTIGIGRLRVGKRCRLVIDHGIAEQTIENPRAERVRHTDIRLIGEDDDAKLVLELEADIGAEAESPTIVPHDRAVRRLLNKPAKRIRQLVIERDFRRVGVDEVRRRDDAMAFEGAAGKLHADPLRHVLDVRVDVDARLHGVVRPRRHARQQQGCPRGCGQSQFELHMVPPWGVW